MFDTTSARRRWVAAAVAALAAAMVFSTSASAERSLFFEETASAFWAVPHACADGSTVRGDAAGAEHARLRVTRHRGPGSHGASAVPGGLPGRHLVQLGRTGRSGDDHERAESQERHGRRIGSGQGQPRRGHQVSFDVAWTGVGPLETTLNVPGSKRKEREATATGQVTFDGEVLVDGAANHPTRPAPFIRVDTEK